MRLSFSLPLLCLFFFSHCSYQTMRPQILNSTPIETLQVEAVKSKIAFPRIEYLTTQNLITSLQKQSIEIKEGEIKKLTVTVVNINYQPLQYASGDYLKTESFKMTVFLKWRLEENSGEILLEGISNGSTTFYAHRNFQTARENALPHALRKGAEKIAKKISIYF